MNTRMLFGLVLLLSGCIEAAPTSTSLSADGGADAGADVATSDMSTDAQRDTNVEEDTGADMGMDVSIDMATPCGEREVATPGGECVCDRMGGFTECVGAEQCVPVAECMENLADDEDTNLDGADGLVILGVFVSEATGDDQNSGLLPSEPVKTLTKAVDVANQHNRSHFYLTTGEYTAPNAWELTVAGSVIVGGYQPDFIASDSGVTRIGTLGTKPTLSVINADMVKIARVEFHAPMTTAASPHAITLWLDTADVTLGNVVVRRGTGFGGLAGPSGGAGNPGASASQRDGGQLMCTGGVILYGGDGGVGGRCGNQARVPEAGYDGSTSTGQPRQGSGGDPGVSDCTISLQSSPGGHGKVGGDAPRATSGAQRPIELQIVDGLWSNGLGGDAGTPGENGEGGGGGGGGGASGVVAQLNSGGDGGGGGSGGCGGRPGRGGSNGGDSIGIVSLQSMISGQVEIIGGAGGLGGKGGTGGCGGARGLGNTAVGVGKNAGGMGADGGNGGTAGSGAGGNGGSVYGIVHTPGSFGEVAIVETDGVPGEGGLGGEGLTCPTGQQGNPGEEGQGGDSAKTREIQ